MDAVNINFLVLALAALIPLVMGFIWYNPKVVGNAWMKASGLDEEKMKGANMGLIFLLCYIFSFMIAFALVSIVIHQFGVMGMMANDPTLKEPSSEFAQLMAKHGHNFRTFRHGALHGCICSVFFVMPIIAINAMFERKTAKYVLIHLGYWFITLGLMGGIICQFN
jgi:hypothetical protein